MPTIYDSKTDDVREAVQADVDTLCRCAQAFGGLVEYLRKSPDLADRQAGDVAVAMSQGAISVTTGAMQLKGLRH